MKLRECHEDEEKEIQSCAEKYLPVYEQPPKYKPEEHEYGYRVSHDILHEVNN